MNIVSIEKLDSNLPGLPLVEVVYCRVVLCTVVGKVVGDRGPKILELALIISATEPVKLHAN